MYCGRRNVFKDVISLGLSVFKKQLYMSIHPFARCGKSIKIYKVRCRQLVS
ncbi:hypothetical protein Hanom_Chr15g01362781 [Helianthus anomalus]